MLKRRKFIPNLLSISIIDPWLHYEIYAQNWWKKVNIKSATEIKHFTVPYHLYMLIKCELNGKEFVITVISNDKNFLKPGFLCTCGEIKSEIESSPSAAIKTCYQIIFGTKTEYSDLAVIGFENENIIQQLIVDILFFPIFFVLKNS